MEPPYPRDDLDEATRALFGSLATGTPEENVARMRPEFSSWRSQVDPEDRDDHALATRWVETLPAEDRAVVTGPDEEVAAAAREAILVADGYLADSALVFSPWAFDLGAVRCPVSLWYGDRDRNAPPRNGVWLAGQLSHASLRVLPGLEHLETLVRSWEPILADLS
jgi:pimeloyl-ACP methyl ester carboxylesterase